MGQNNFTFVNNTAGKVGSRTEQDDDLSSIRSHAMRIVRQRRERRGLEVKSEETSSKLATGDLGRPTRRQKSSLSSSIPERLYGIPLTLPNEPSDVGIYLDYFLYGFTPSTFPTKHIRHDCDMITTVATTRDPALLHALCALGALHHAQVLQAASSNFSPGSLVRSPHMFRAFSQHKMRAITLLRSRFSESTGIDYTSSTATVALLLLIEVMYGDRKTSLTHTRGLLALLDQSQWQDTEAGPLVADVLMIDTKSATLNGLPPSVRPPITWMKRFGYLKMSQYSTGWTRHKCMGSGFLTAEMRRDLGIPFIRILLAMGKLIDTLELNMSEDNMASEIDGSHFLALEYELLEYQVNWEIGIYANKRVLECCRLAALLYCNICVWIWPKGTTLVESLLSQLRTAILEWTLDPKCPQNLPFLLWLYFLGTLADSNTEDGHFYQWGVRTTAGSLSLRSDGELRKELQRYFYVERAMHPFLRTVLSGLHNASRSG